MQSSFRKFKAGQPKSRVRKNNQIERPNVEVLTSKDAHERNRNEYLSFRANWRSGYADCSNHIRILKSTSKDMNTSERIRQEAMQNLKIARTMARSMMISLDAIKAQYKLEKADTLRMFDEVVADRKIANQ